MQAGVRGAPGPRLCRIGRGSDRIGRGSLLPLYGPEQDAPVHSAAAQPIDLFCEGVFRG